MDIALENMAKDFIFAGISERFDESLLLLKNILGWRISPYYVRQNVTKSRPFLNDVPSQVRKKIEKRNVMDCALYEHVEKEFNELLKELGSKIIKDIERFKGMNTKYQKIYSKIRPLKRFFSIGISKS